MNELEVLSKMLNNAATQVKPQMTDELRKGGDEIVAQEGNQSRTGLAGQKRVKVMNDKVVVGTEGTSYGASPARVSGRTGFPASTKSLYDMQPREEQQKPVRLDGVLDRLADAALNIGTGLILKGGA